MHAGDLQFGMLSSFGHGISEGGCDSSTICQKAIDFKRFGICAEKRQRARQLLQAAGQDSLAQPSFFMGQVLKPRMGYSGQNLINPVARGTTPIQPHTLTPDTATPISANPTTMRKILSMPPTFAFMMSSIA